MPASPPAPSPQEEFLGLLEPLRNELHRFARRMMASKENAEDVLQEAVLSAYADFGRFKKGTGFRPWIYKFLVHKIMNANRKTRRSVEVPVGDREGDLPAFGGNLGEPGSFLPDPERFLEALGDELYRAVRELSPPERACLLLRAAEEFSYREIADLLVLPIGTVMSHIFRARVKVRGLLAGAEKRAI